MDVTVNFRKVQPVESVVITLNSDEATKLTEVLGKLSCATVSELLGVGYDDAKDAYDVTANIYFAITDTIDPVEW